MYNGSRQKAKADTRWQQNDEAITCRGRDAKIVTEVDNKFEDLDRAWNYRRGPNEGMEEFILEFEARWQMVWMAGVHSLGEKGRTLMLLQRANLTRQQRNQVMAQSEQQQDGNKKPLYCRVKKQLRAKFSSRDPVRLNSRNPETGRRRKCSICGSEHHFARACPNEGDMKQDQRTNKERRDYDTWDSEDGSIQTYSWNEEHQQKSTQGEENSSVETERQHRATYRQA